MSQPVPQGYPDYIRRTPMADQLLIRDTQVNKVGVTTYNIGYLANIPALWFFFQAVGDSWRIQFQWFADAALTQALGISVMDVRDGCTANRTFRPFTPYMKVTVTPNAGGVGTFTIYLTTTADINTPAFSKQVVNLIGTGVVAIPAGGTITLSATNCFIGPAVWSGDVVGTAYNFSLITLDFAGAITVVDAFANGVARWAPRPVYLGGGQPQIVVHNADGVANNYQAYLSVATGTGY